MTDPLDPPQLRWCFSTLGCADLPFQAICELAGKFRIPGIELRGVGGRMDMPAYFSEQELTPDRVNGFCRLHRTQLVVAGSSVKLTSGTERERAELSAFGEWAESLSIPYLRVFGGGTWGTPLTAADYETATRLVNWWREHRTERGWQVDLLLETHDAFSAAEPCLRLNERLERPLEIIWDSHHTWRIGGESPAATWNQLGSLVRHVHLKDSVDRPSARHPYTYVLPGSGQMPMAEVAAILRKHGYPGFVSLEWERHWHPYLPPLEKALAVLAEQPWFNPAPGGFGTPTPAR